MTHSAAPQPNHHTDTLPPQSPVTEASQQQLAAAQAALATATQHVGDARLLLDLGQPFDARVSLTLASSSADRAAQAVRAVLGALAVLAMAVGLVAGAPGGRAEAAAVPLGQPVKVVISDRTATLRAQVIATAPTTARGTGRWVAVSAPIGTGRSQVRVGAFASRTGAVVPVRVTLPAAVMPLGRSTWMTRDLGDGQLTPMAVDARQASRMPVAAAYAQWPGTVTVTAQVQHYRAAAAAWGGSQLSPVQVQAWLGGQWVTTATLTTDSTGWAIGTVPVPAGVDVVRLARPDGATVWGVSRVVPVEGADYDVAAAAERLAAGTA